MDTFELIKGAIDIHIHIGPDPNRRRRVGVERTIITHPLSVSFGCRASVEEQKEMIGQGVFIEHCFIATMPTSDRVDPQKIADAIRAVGPEHGIMSTDFGVQWDGSLTGIGLAAQGRT